MTLGYSIHEVILSKKVKVAPGQVHDFGESYSDLKRIKAIRPVTADEKKQYDDTVAEAKAVAKAAASNTVSPDVGKIASDSKLELK